MKQHAAKLLATVLCASSVWGVSAAPAEAFIFPWCWGGCGPCGSGYGSGYRSYYGPVSYGGCAPCGTSCSPCAVGCAPCGGYAYGGSCPSGDCALGSSSVVSPSPMPDNGWQKKQPQTYATPPGTGGANDATLGEPGTIDRTAPDAGFDGTNRGKPLEDSGSVEAFRPDGSNSGESVPVQPKGGKKAGPDVQPIPEDKDISAPKLPTINLDEKIAWRAAPERKRLQLEKPVRNAHLVRLPVYPKSDWIPVSSESKVARN